MKDTIVKILTDERDSARAATAEACRMMFAIKNTWGPESNDDGADGELWAWLNDFVIRHSRPHVDSGDEALIYLHSQIDPHDTMNPKYARLWKQVEAINSAKATILAAQTTTSFIAQCRCADPAARCPIHA
jgi:hypothetical protein